MIIKVHSSYPSSRPSLIRRGERGFALIATISVMVLLIMIALAMLSLSTIELRSSQNGRAMAEAQANARMALMLAIGELQKSTGPDTRITAPLDILDTNAPPLIGVWKSWEGNNHDSTGRPTMPDYSSKTRSANSGNGRFVGYLVSGAAELSDPENDSLTDLVKTSSTSTSVPLLSIGTLGSNSGQVHLEPQFIENESGAMAWWVSPENQKARLMQPYNPRTNNAIGLVETGQSHSVPNSEVFSLAGLVDDPELFIPDPSDAKSASKSLSLRTTTLLPEATTSNPAESFHDLSTSAVGLLTNSATGGWRKDISVLTERWDNIYASYPGRKLPLFRFTPDSGATSQVPKPTTSDYDPEQSNLYPWSEYSVIIGYKQPATYYAASASWASLRSFATSYKNFSYNSEVVTSPFVWDKIAKQRESSITSNEIYNHKHRQLLHPQIARFQALVYAKAVEDPSRLDQTPKRYELRLMYVPFFTLWNPYNVSLEHTISGTLNAGQGSGKHTNFLGLGWRRSLPGAMAIVDKSTYTNPDLVPSAQYRMLTNGNFQTLDWPKNYANEYDNNLPGNLAKYGSRSVWRDLRTWACWLPEGTLTFKPGEAKIFSPEWIDNGYGFGGGAFRMKEGYSPTSIVGRDFRISSNLLATKNYWFLFRNDRLTQPYRDRAPGNGFSLSFGNGSSHFGGTAILPSGLGEEYHNITALTTGSEGDKYWPPDEVDEVGYSVAELASGPWIPLFSMSFGPRMTIGTGPGTKQNRPTKGVVQNNALAAMVLSEPESGEAKDHPANNTFDFAYHSLSLGSTITPNLSDSEGFIGTGYQSGDGLSRLIMAEIPLRPMASLVELQGWNPRGNNPYPPFQMNLIGNSDATPLIPKDDIVPLTMHPNSVELNLQHDDAYCANHMLFDDWFVSSIAPQPQNLGGSIAKDLKTFYRDVMTGQDKLSNRSYHAISADSGLTGTQATERVNEIINSSESFLKVASRLEVTGMFNVNSTSVDAWKALLGHAKNLEEIAFHGVNGIESTTGANAHAVTRGAVATDYEAGSGNSISGLAANASEFTGFRSLTDDQIEDLAEKIVEQVRLRGPFLSLSEFVNRQLSTNTNLALAGAVQTAINNLKDDPMKELRDPANMLSDTTMYETNPNDPKLAGADYKFSEAAEGSSAHGVPGWIRQADVLRPIAPVLSARDDTFTIRAYGDARDNDGNIVARAWCEATIQRSRDFVDSSDQGDSIEPPTNAVNQIFGRKYVIKSFRWLNAEEV
jgi:hypothetical protein